MKKKKYISFLVFSSLCFLISFFAFAQDKKANAASADAKNAPNVIYKYKKHQEFDFEDLNVQGEPGGALGDITVGSRTLKDYQNKLPYRKNFIPELKKTLEKVR